MGHPDGAGPPRRARLRAEYQAFARLLLNDLPSADLSRFVTTLDRVLGRLSETELDRLRDAVSKRRGRAERARQLHKAC